MANNNIILIPSTPVDMPIGSVFNNFFVISSATETLDNNVVWDFSNVFHIHPILAAALALYRYSCGKSIEIINTQPKIAEYLESILFLNIQDLSSNSIELDLNAYKNLHYTPLVYIKANDDATQRKIQDMIIQQSDAKGISTAMDYILGELICNIEQHAESDKAFIFSQYVEQENAIYLCIADNGIGIYSSYVKAQKFLSEIGDNDAEAVKIANEGFSTKNRPEAENRGFGISTSKSMLVNGLGGSFFLMSGSALQMSIHGVSDSFIELPANVEWQGTMIFLKIPRFAPKGFIYTDYLE